MSYNPVNPNGQATSANSAPVVIASDQSAVAVSAGSLPLPSNAATESGGNLATLAGTVASSKVNVNVSSGSLAVLAGPQTSGGLSTATGSIGATATAVKTSAGQLYGWAFFNNNAAQSYVQFFNDITSNITVGTTAPFFSMAIPAGGGANTFTDIGIAFSTAITIAITTTRTGNTAPTATVDYNLWYY